MQLLKSEDASKQIGNPLAFSFEEDTILKSPTTKRGILAQIIEMSNIRSHKGSLSILVHLE